MQGSLVRWKVTSKNKKKSGSMRKIWRRAYKKGDEMKRLEEYEIIYI